MKIDQTTFLTGQSRTQKNKSASGTGFKKIFEANCVEKGATVQTTPTAPIGPVTPVGCQANPDVSRVMRVVDLLDAYRQAMADPKKNLKDMGNLVQSLNREADVLDHRAAEVDKPILKNLLNRTAVTAKVEVIKFNRGDYI